MLRARLLAGVENQSRRCGEQGCGHELELVRGPVPRPQTDRTSLHADGVAVPIGATESVETVLLGEAQSHLGGIPLV